ncbi:Ninja-family protein [Actinidia chinensis var. chinensis]|uniref:Ninja-family protein n=1 Tax=Actinidia chinensis var. chinensis TaxID=1590841 RepID=A0A2R6RKF6_ACTCC|nr:Ninja-family protein [Actinidia chinensis var. chinensis]
MSEAKEKRTHPRDLFRGSVSGKNFPRESEETMGDDEEEIELSLGLSSNGRFGVDPMKRARKLNRSSSISDFTSKNDCNNVAARGEYAPLMRLCSLPAEAEEEWKKRKDIQSMRRMEAKRKRLEKMKRATPARDRAAVNGNSEEIVPIQSKKFVIESRGERGSSERLLPQPSLQGSIGSFGSGSSGISESGTQPIQGTNGCTEARSPASVQSLPKHNEHKPLVTPGAALEKPVKYVGGAAVGNPSAKVTVNNNIEATRNMMIDMPCVSTRVLGPNGKRIEGFLYRYRKGEEVRIVCVCHGSFLSPAEFVKHAGGGDVSHPLKHIVVGPSSFL